MYIAMMDIDAVTTHVQKRNANNKNIKGSNCQTEYNKTESKKKL
jgi:hypothetical protein